MGIFSKLFGSKKLIINDPNFGKIQSINKRGKELIWQTHIKFLDTNIEVLFSGNKDGINPKQKQIVLSALKNEKEIYQQANLTLKAAYEDASMKYETLAKHFEINALSVNDLGFDLSFQQLNDPYYYFNVHYLNNKADGFSIDS